jgi:hypothetical protein
VTSVASPAADLATGSTSTGVLANKRIPLVLLSAGRLGVETAGLLGALLLATLWQAILGRIRLSPGERQPVFVYIDEAQSMLKLPVDLADMLAQARGLSVGSLWPTSTSARSMTSRFAAQCSAPCAARSSSSASGRTPPLWHRPTNHG